MYNDRSKGESKGAYWMYCVTDTVYNWVVSQKMTVVYYWNKRFLRSYNL